MSPEEMKHNVRQGNDAVLRTPNGQYPPGDAPNLGSTSGVSCQSKTTAKSPEHPQTGTSEVKKKNP